MRDFLCENKKTLLNLQAFTLFTSQRFIEPQFGNLYTYLSLIVLIYLFVKIIGD